MVVVESDTSASSTTNATTMPWVSTQWYCFRHDSTAWKYEDRCKCFPGKQSTSTFNPISSSSSSSAYSSFSSRTDSIATMSSSLFSSSSSSTGTSSQQKQERRGTKRKHSDMTRCYDTGYEGLQTSLSTMLQSPPKRSLLLVQGTGDQSQVSFRVRYRNDWRAEDHEKRYPDWLTSKNSTNAFSSCLSSFKSSSSSSSSSCSSQSSSINCHGI